MKKESRKVIIAGNWKMNMTPSAAKTAVAETARLTEGKNGCEVVLCVPFVDIANAVEAAKGTQVKSAHRTFTSRRRVRSQVKFPLICSTNAA